MEIILGKKAGFCYGVERAINNADKVITENQNAKVYCLGDLVHNKQVIEEFEKKGIVFINDINEIDEKEKNVKLIIRAHGIPKITYEEAKKRNIEIFDYSCPSVLAMHKMVENAVEDGFYVLLLGEKKHPEVIGTYGFTKNKGILLETEEEIEETILEIKAKKVEKLFVVAQTTFNKEKFNKYIEKIKEGLENYLEKLEVKNTICDATRVRQEETKEIASNVDYMIVIGGKKSSNSMKLYNISKQNCKNVIFIETYKEITDENLKDIQNSNKVGIMAGASTPKKSIEDVIKYIK